MTERPLGRRPATDDRHLARYSLTPRTMPTSPTPVVIGCNWYTAFDAPVTGDDGAFWIGRQGLLGTIRGGHAVCLKPPSLRDNLAWWQFFDQGSEGACVGFASSRMMTLLNRRRYDGFALYRHAQRIDEFADTPPAAGSSVRAGMDVLRLHGAYRSRQGVAATEPTPEDGLLENRWATSVEDILDCLAEERGFVEVLNSWGTGYPQIVRMPLDLLDRLVFAEDGDATVVTDKPGPTR